MATGINLYSPTPPPDASFARRLAKRVGGMTSAIGRSIHKVMQLSGISPDETKTSSKESDADVIGRSESESFITDAERAFTAYAQTQRDPSEALERSRELIERARENPGSQESLNTMIEIYTKLKQARDATREPGVKTEITKLLRKAPDKVAKGANVESSRSMAA
ncbi:hypothetical protein HOF56_04405 [Candidatus Peribacteria bacterium]|jgi:hypothetical protein|nr:hypothetical protein [Candidatus Peribacteria bacterium]MBT4021615.1 hypothetical protein [Candidatus Peribacteria bacterium]MBT4241090.1 hypothetical protein [Candidatus Peribacteria bacterium]MBT4474340.1 hypothetical protein [Candidatus Peribacteria bacterium]